MLEQRRRQVLIMHRNRHAEIAAARVKQPCVASRLVINVEPCALQRRDDLLRL